MRRSPLRHPLAILRTTIGLTQKELAALVDRAARTIQAVELRQLPLSEDLAMQISQATGVDAGWLLQGAPEVPPLKGSTMLGMGAGRGDYTRADYEFHRAFIESPVATKEEVEAVLKSGDRFKNRKSRLVTVSMPLVKAGMLKMKKQLLARADQQLVEALKLMLDQTAAKEVGDLIRWKIRRLLQELASQHALKLVMPPAAKTDFIHVHVVDEPKSGDSRRRKMKT